MPRKKQKSALDSTQAAALLSERASFEYKGTKYALVLTYRTRLKFEALTGISTITDAYQIYMRPTLTALAAMLYALLSGAGCEASHDEVTDYVSRDENTPRSFDAVLAAYTNSRVKEKAADPLHPPAIQ